jgi:hypothetical protein
MFLLSILLIIQEFKQSIWALLLQQLNLQWSLQEISSRHITHSILYNI